MHDVLISYSHKDKTIADAICNQLESNGIRVWIAPRDIDVSEYFLSAFVEEVSDNSAANRGIQGLERDIRQVINHQRYISL